MDFRWFLSTSPLICFWKIIETFPNALMHKPSLPPVLYTQTETNFVLLNEYVWQIYQFIFVSQWDLSSASQLLLASTTVLYLTAVPEIIMWFDDVREDRQSCLVHYCLFETTTTQFWSRLPRIKEQVFRTATGENSDNRNKNKENKWIKYW